MGHGFSMPAMTKKTLPLMLSLTILGEIFIFAFRHSPVDLIGVLCLVGALAIGWRADHRKFIRAFVINLIVVGVVTRAILMISH